MRFVRDIAISIGIHACLAAALALYLAHAPDPDTLPQLDLTSVELSFEAENGTASGAAASSPQRKMKETLKSLQEPPTPAVAGTPPPLSTPPPPSTPPSPSTPPPVNVETDLRPAESPKKVEAVTCGAASSGAASSGAAASQQAHVDAPPRPERNIRPNYPREARRRGEQGTVTLEVDVNAEGLVEAVRIVTSCGYRLLEEAALRAVRAARFTPARKDGEVVPATVRLPLAFTLK